MTKETIKQKAIELGQKYFPDECNIWARDNVEASYVSSACIEMALYVHKTLIEEIKKQLNFDFYCLLLYSNLNFGLHQIVNVSYNIRFIFII